MASIAPLVSNVSPFPVLSIWTALIAREPPLKVLISASRFADKKNAWRRYSLKVCDVNGKFTLGRGFSNSGSIKVLGDIYIAAGRTGGRFLNVVHRWRSFDAQSGSNDGLSIDG